MLGEAPAFETVRKASQLRIYGKSQADRSSAQTSPPLLIKARRLRPSRPGWQDADLGVASQSAVGNKTARRQIARRDPNLALESARAHLHKATAGGCYATAGLQTSATPSIRFAALRSDWLQKAACLRLPRRHPKLLAGRPIVARRPTGEDARREPPASCCFLDMSRSDKVQSRLSTVESGNCQRSGGNLHDYKRRPITDH